MKVLKKFYTYVWKFKKFFIVALILNIIFAVLSNLLPLLFRDVVNYALEGQIELIFRVLIIISVIVLITYLGDALTMYISDFALFGAASKLKQDVLRHLHDLDFMYHANKSSGRLISIFKRGENAFFSFYDEINMWISRVVLDFIIVTAIYSSIYPKLMIITAIAFFINAIAMYFTVKNNVSKRKIVNNTEDDVNAMVVDNMIAFDTVKYFANEKYEQKRFKTIMYQWYRDCINYAFTFRIIDLVNGGITNGAFLLSIIVAVYDLSKNSINTGEFVLALTFVSTFYPKIKHLVFQFRELAKNYEDLKIYVGVLDEEISVKDNAKPISVDDQKRLNRKNVEIKFDKVSFGYDQNQLIFKNLNLVIKPGESIALVGHSGVGKTTLVKLLMRIFDPISGEIYINDVNIKNIPKVELRKLISMVPQEVSLFNNTIGYNIAYGKAEDYTDIELEQASERAYLQNFIYSLLEDMTRK
jgi:ATP-binding cassette, subfamily B, heavy metal transporter